MNITLIPLYLKQNMGHGNARRISLENCKNEMITMMDADDISYVNRFEKQITNFMEDNNIDIVGGQITEFINSPDNIIGRRVVPEKDRDIKKYLKKRCPMNHVTVMFKKTAVERAGGYLDWYCNEDYYLWIRMAIAGNKFANVSDTLVNVRVGDEMSARRGGWRYFKSEAALQKYMLHNKLISFPSYLYNILIRFGGEVIVSDKLRQKLFQYMREKYEEKEEKIQLSKVKVNDKGKQKRDRKYPPFSVAMCVYGKDNAVWFDEALASITINQTVKPDEVVLVVDGPIPHQIQDVIEKYEKILRGRLKAIYCKKNHGLGKSLKIAVELAKNEIIARMDSDDLAMPERFEIQLNKIMESLS